MPIMSFARESIFPKGCEEIEGRLLCAQKIVADGQNGIVAEPIDSFPLRVQEPFWALQPVSSTIWINWIKFIKSHNDQSSCLAKYRRFLVFSFLS